MSERIPGALRLQIRDRAAGRCEYCLLGEDESMFPHEADHIIATKHRGPTEKANLAWTCFVCNRSKGSDLSSIDAETGELVRLFNPRTDEWSDHFLVNKDGRIFGLTAIGRVTVSLLKFNLTNNVQMRGLLMSAGRYP